MLISLHDQLCATGTVGIAAVGFAFASPQRPVIARPTSRKRKALNHSTFDDSRSASFTPTTPFVPSHSVSAPTSQLLNTGSFDQLRSPSIRPNASRGTITSTPSVSANNGGVWGEPSSVRDSKVVANEEPSISESRTTRTARSSLLRRLSMLSFSQDEIPIATPQADRIASDGSDRAEPPSLRDVSVSANEESDTFEAKGPGTAKPSLLRRLSNLSFFENESQLSSPQPGSPSISLSNGSAVPILNAASGSIPAILPRNKLVKRSSSQRALHGSAIAHSTLRRPATSHQRSATLQQHHFNDHEYQCRSPSRQSHLTDDLMPNHEIVSNDLAQKWHPFFKTRPGRLIKEEPSRKRSSPGEPNRYEGLKYIVPNVLEAPTLLLATSITPGASENTTNDRISQFPGRTRPSTSAGLTTFIPSFTGTTETTISANMEQKRHSFSFTEFFPSSSPSTWKLPRSGSLRNVKASNRLPSSRRNFSAPQSKLPTQGESGSGNVSKERSQGIKRTNSPHSGFSPKDHPELTQPSPTSPLNRLSSFGIDLPGAAPSYPTSPQTDASSSSPKLPTSMSPSVPSPPGPVSVRKKPHRQSNAPSDHASTLIGSDNDNGRFMSGDEDDADGRSETVFDSTRTGATGSSHYGLRGPRIETIFDESPPPELRKNKLDALQELLLNGSFQRHRIAEEEESISTPVRSTAPCKEEDSSTPVRVTRKTLQSPSLPSSPPTNPLELQSRNLQEQDMADPQDDEVWSFEDAEGTHWEDRNETPMTSGDSHSLQDSPQLNATLPESPDFKGFDGYRGPAKSKMSDWSEQPHFEKDLFQDSSPRPNTVDGNQSQDTRGSRLPGRRGPSALHLRSQSVPIPPDPSAYRGHTNTSKLESWVLGNKGVSEDWDGDFDFEEPPRANRQASVDKEAKEQKNSSGMLVPQAIMERQASVHGQFGQVKELTLLVEELKRLRLQAGIQGILQGQSIELWKEAEGIINLATLDDDEQELLPPHSPYSPSLDFDPFEEESPSSQRRRRSGVSPPKELRSSDVEKLARPHTTPSSSPGNTKSDKFPTTRPRKESSAKAKSVLENIHQQRSHYDPALLDAKSSQKKLPFDTTSLRDLVTRAGVVTRALKEIVRRAENLPATPVSQHPTPPDPPFSQIFQKPPNSPSVTKRPRGPPSPNGGSFLGGTVTGNDNDINGHMKMMTVV
ncbi:hypothetical protein MMC12_000322 [Toensbergia leucococca]|nr:hypothetical protein [Toensbergia leucococca]